MNSSAGYSEPSSAGCKQFSVGFPALEDSGSTATAEVAVNGMDPPDLGFSPAEANADTTGQWRRARWSARASRSLPAALVYLLPRVMREDERDLSFSTSFLSQHDGTGGGQERFNLLTRRRTSGAELSLSERCCCRLSECLRSSSYV